MIMTEECRNIIECTASDILKNFFVKYGLSDEDIKAVTDSVCDGVAKAYVLGKSVFLYHIAEMQRKTFDLETGKEDFYWSIGAGFNDREEAENYIAKQKENSPEKTYCIFEGGIIPRQIF